LLLVTESLTLMAGNRSDPLSCIWYKRFTPVVVSSETPTNLSTILWYFLGFSFIPSLHIYTHNNETVQTKEGPTTEDGVMREDFFFIVVAVCFS
jgi:hypothetical protein